MLKLFKFTLTKIGSFLPEQQSVQAQGLVNYMRLGRWMKSHGFHFPARVPDRYGVYERIAGKIGSRSVLYLEFGVGTGASMAWWSQALKNPTDLLHGFDSFEGLPEGGGLWQKGQFDMNGHAPAINDSRVKFFKGWFDKTLPNYALPPHELLIVNMDADLYSSTSYVLQWLRPHFKPGTLIYFDEMNHVDHELRAFGELMETGLRFKPIAGDYTLAFVGFECLG